MSSSKANVGVSVSDVLVSTTVRGSVSRSPDRRCGLIPHFGVKNRVKSVVSVPRRRRPARRLV